MTTPEKIEVGLEVLDRCLKDVYKNFYLIESSSQQIYKSTASVLDVYDDLPLERMRAIKPLIEEVIDKRDELVDDLSRLESLKDSIDAIQSAVKNLNSYFQDVYMESVRARESRDR